MNKTEIRVTISYPTDLELAKEKLLSNNQNIDNDRFIFFDTPNVECHLIYGIRGWFIGNTIYRTEITIDQLEEILKNEKK